MPANTYQITDIYTGEAMKIGFASRAEAKAERDELNKKQFSPELFEALKAQDTMPRFVISRGSDHPWGQSESLPQENVTSLKSRFHKDEHKKKAAKKEKQNEKLKELSKNKETKKRENK